MALITYAMAKYKGASYPDCGETSLRNFFNFILAKHGVIAPDTLEAFLAKCAGQPEEHKGEKGPGRPIAHKELDHLAGFYRSYSKLSEQFSETARNAWSEVVSNLNHTHDPLLIDYRERTHNLSGGPGIVNMLNLIAHLLPDPVLNHPWSKDPGVRMEEAGRKLDALCALASRDGFAVEWQVGGMKQVNNPHPTIQFSINESAALAWEFNAHHYALVDLSASAGLGREGAGVARYGGFLAQAWKCRLSPSPYRIDPLAPLPVLAPLASLDQMFSENLRDPDVALGLTSCLLVSDPTMARTPTFSLLLRSLVPDYQTADILSRGLARRRDLTEDRGFYPMGALLRWPQSARGRILLVAANGNVGITKLMIDHGADVNATVPVLFLRKNVRPIFRAIDSSSGDEETTEDSLGLLLATRPRLNLNVIGYDQTTPLIHALRKGRAFARLLAAGADPNFPDGERITPLNRAVMFRKLPEAEALLEAGADPFKKNRDGMDAVDYAWLNKSLDILALIERRFPGRTKDSIHKPKEP